MKELIIKDINGLLIGYVVSETVIIRELQDAVDIMAEGNYQGAAGIIMNEKNFSNEFFDLSTGVAGEILQKFSTYRMKLSIVGDFSKFKRKSLSSFISESNRYGHTTFVSSLEEAESILTKKANNI